MDFQVREPIAPILAGGMPKSHVMMEVQAAQEYVGRRAEKDLTAFRPSISSDRLVTRPSPSCEQNEICAKGIQEQNELNGCVVM